jgi:hypothetical protein
MRPDLGVPYDVIDPIEVWGGWSDVVRSRRPVFVLDVGPERAPWPDFKPTELTNITRGSITSAKLVRDGAEIALSGSETIPALFNADAHVAARRPNPTMFVATVPPDAFAPHADGKWPRIEVHALDAGGRTIRLRLSEQMMRRLHDEFAPWRDLALPPARPPQP